MRIIAAEDNVNNEKASKDETQLLIMMMRWIISIIKMPTMKDQIKNQNI